MSHPVPITIDITPQWSITLNDQFEKQMQGETLHLFNNMLSIWISCFGTQDGVNIVDRMDRDEARAPENAKQKTRNISQGIGRITYIAPAQPSDDIPKPPIFYTYTHATDSQLMMAFFHKGPTSLKSAQDIYASLIYKEA